MVLAKKDSLRGFTLLELIIVIAIIAVLAVTIFFSLDPGQRFVDARNAQRWSELQVIGEAIKIYQIDHGGVYPVGLDENWRMLGQDNGGCDINCGSGGIVGITSFSDDDQMDFNEGNYNDTRWNSFRGWLELDEIGQANGSGEYVSEIKNANVEVGWQTFSWVPAQPYGKPLPNNAISESSYDVGNANMSGNVLLMHLDENSGGIIDSSGNGNNGVNNGAVYGVSGRLNTAMSFNGTDNNISISSASSLNFSNSGTFLAWVQTRQNKTAKILEKGDWNGHGIYQDVWNGWKTTFRIAGLSYSTDWGAGIPTFNQWYHVAGVYDGTAVIMYVNGAEMNRVNVSGSLSTNANSAFIGSTNGQKFFNGLIDEVAIFNRALSAVEIRQHYLRGAQRLKYQVRSCNDQFCFGDDFIGPDGTADTYYTEGNNLSENLPSFNLTNILDNRYFQYRGYWEVDGFDDSPALESVFIETDASFSGSGELLQSTCLDLSGDLAPYLGQLPEDPSGGSLDKTYYAVRKQLNGIIDIMACNAEDGNEIKISR